MPSISSQEIQALLAAQLPEEDAGWLCGLDFELQGGRLGLGFAHAHFAAWFMAQKRAVFEAALARAFPDLLPDYGPLCHSWTKDEASQAKAEAQAPLAARDNLMPPDLRQKQESSPKNAPDSAPENALADFFCNSSNDLPLAAARELVLGRGASLTLFLGAGGVGKSWLLRCLASAWLKLCAQNYPDQNYSGKNQPDELGGKGRDPLSASGMEALEAAGIRLIHGGEIQAAQVQDFNPGRFWKSHWALLLDNLERLDPKAQEELLGLISCLDSPDGHSFRRIVLALGADGQKNLDPALLTRLSGALSLEILPPDLDVRLRYLEAQSAGLGLGRDQLLILARQGDNFHALNGLLQKLRSWSKVHSQPLGDSELERLMRMGSLARPLSCREILASVARGFALAPEEILGQSRSPELVLARQMAMYLCRRRLALSYPELGRAFGGRDHSTVIHAVRKIGKLRLTDKVVHKMLTELETTHR